MNQRRKKRMRRKKSCRRVNDRTLANFLLETISAPRVIVSSALKACRAFLSESSSVLVLPSSVTPPSRRTLVPLAVPPCPPASLGPTLFRSLPLRAPSLHSTGPSLFSAAPPSSHSARSATCPASESAR